MNKSKYVSHFGNHHLATWWNSILFICHSVKTTYFDNLTVSAGPAFECGLPKFSASALLGAILESIHHINKIKYLVHSNEETWLDSHANSWECPDVCSNVLMVQTHECKRKSVLHRGPYNLNGWVITHQQKIVEPQNHQTVFVRMIAHLEVL